MLTYWAPVSQCSSLLPLLPKLFFFFKSQTVRLQQKSSFCLRLPDFLKNVLFCLSSLQPLPHKFYFPLCCILSSLLLPLPIFIIFTISADPSLLPPVFSRPFNLDFYRKNFYFHSGKWGELSETPFVCLILSPQVREMFLHMKWWHWREERKSLILTHLWASFTKQPSLQMSASWRGGSRTRLSKVPFEAHSQKKRYSVHSCVVLRVCEYASV